jgi:YrbI family 3-deoxy-D-manno-octulosonate 8-phosphate phosphatase
MDPLTDKARKIKLVGTDIDGVWTDSKMYVTPEGEWMKAFSTYDGMATAMLKEKGIIVAILTGENSDVVLARAEKLKIDEVYVDEHEKLKRLTYLTKKYEISMEEVAFIGDDVNDLEVLDVVGLSAMAGNSPILNQFSPDYVTTRYGGNGAFREFADIILNAQ